MFFLWLSCLVLEPCLRNIKWRCLFIDNMFCLIWSLNLFLNGFVVLPLKVDISSWAQRALMSFEFRHENGVGKCYANFLFLIEKIRSVVWILLGFFEAVGLWHKSAWVLPVFDEVLDAFIFDVLGVIVVDKFRVDLLGSMRPAFAKGYFCLWGFRGFFKTWNLSI